MDYDLFQSDDDEDILSAYLQVSQKLPPEPQVQLQLLGNSDELNVATDDDRDALDMLPEFNCSGRDTSRASNDLPNTGFVRNGYALDAPVPRSRLDRLSFNFEEGQLQVCMVVRYLQGEACKNIQKLCGAVAGQQHLQSKSALSAATASWYEARQQVTHFYHWLLHDVQISEQWHIISPGVRQLRELLNSCLDASAWRVLYFAEHVKGNECQAPAYQLYHGALEWRLLDLCLLRKHQTATGEEEEEDQLCYQTQLARIFDDLVLCANYHYRSKHSAELLHTSAFVCRCSKELWLLLHQQMGLECAFWPLFHRAMQRHKTQLQPECGNNATALAYHEFYAWLRLSLARLAAYGADGLQLSKPATVGAELLQTGSLLRQFLACQPDEQQRRVYLCLIAPLQLRWAQPDTDVLCQLWEYLHRMLNSSFSMQLLEQLPLICTSGAAYVERYRMLLARPQMEDLNLSSFTIFVLLLGKTLQQLPSLGRTGAQKLMGRIFSKFSAAKLLALNESGIHHVIELFLCLLLTYAEFGELAPKLRELLLCLALDKLPPARRQLAAKGHMALLLLHAQRRQPMEDYVSKLLVQLAVVRNDVDVGGIFGATLQPIFELADDCARGEQLLVSSWLTHYLEHSGQAAQERVWQALHLLCQKLKENPSSAMWDALQQHVLPQLRLQYANGYSVWLPKLAADFVALDKDRKLLELLLLGTEPANTAASAQLLLHVLMQQQDDAATVAVAPSVLVIQVWIKSLVLLTAQHESVLALTPHVAQLAEFRALGLDASSLEGREPLCAFFGALGRRAQQQDAVAHVRMQLSHKLHGYVAHFEQWLPPALTEQRPEIGARFYNFLAIVIYNCATLTYVRSKPSCFFHLAMVRFLLTTQLQAGIQPEGRLPQLVHKIFPVLLQGIGRLPYRTDAYLGRTLEQLILHWTPLFGFTSNVKLVARPFATLLQADADGELAQFVLQNLASQFLGVQRNQVGANVGLILMVIQQLFVGLGETKDAPSAEPQLLTLLKAVNIPLLEHIMFVGELEPSRIQVLNLYRQMVHLGVFQRSMAAQEICSDDIRSLAEKHLAHCTYFYFQMLIKLAEPAPQLVAPLYSFVRKQAVNVELKRAAGEDVGIRKCLQRLQQVLQTAPST
ncbi:protein MMS22-like [Drosophila grimshawi]|uniref:Protein MMS22-like n=1 Tax=Drosophila grimshawi TaxID=7222 RepID=B4JMM6_DROGR|nr:protein MMS22-like [Drosophila grimshawi]EDV91969.1 GH24298 [Drosophila grimshawi]